MRTNNPIVVDGKVYDELAMSLAISPVLKENPTFHSAAVVLSLHYVRRENGAFEQLTDPAYRQTLIFSDIFAANDPDVQVAVGKVEAAIQELINKKGL